MMGEKITIKKFFGTIAYSFKITFNASKLRPVIKILFMLFKSTLPFINIYLLNSLLNSLTADTVDEKFVIAKALLLIGFTVIQSLSNRIMGIIEGLFNEKAGVYCRNLFIKKQMVLPMSFSDTPHGKDTISATKNKIDGNGIYAIFDLFVELLSDIYSFALAAAVLINFNLLWAGIFLILILPGCIANYRETAVFDKFDYENIAQKRYHSYYRSILTQQSTAKDVRMYNLTDPLKEKYFKLHNKYLKERRMWNLTFLKLDFFYNLFPIIGMCVFLIALIAAKMNGSITVGELVMYSGIALTYVSSASGIANDFDNTLCFVRWLQPVIEFFNVPCPEEKEDGKELKDFESLEFRNVYFKYPTSEDYVLKGVSFRINKGESAAIIGMNGAGKSTIVKLMIGLYEIESGAILINGIPMGEYSNSSQKKLFSVLFQDFPKYSFTLRENIALSDIERINEDEDIIRALKNAGIDIENELNNPDLDAYMSRAFDDNGIELSKGQWQKIAAARTYFKNAPVVIFDEPSSALDAEAEERIFNTFSAISENRTAIMITHHISGVRKSNKIMVLNNGIIEEMGTHEELIKNNGLYKEMFELQKSRYSPANAAQA